MSLQTELEEVVKWIADLSATSKPDKPEPPTREAWARARSSLSRAAVTLEEAHAALVDEKRPPFLAELAVDLRRQAEELEQRAKMLGRRAAPETVKQLRARLDAEEQEKADAEATSKFRAQVRDEARRKAAAARGEDDKPELDKREPDKTAEKEDEGEPTSPLESVNLLKTALGTIDNAHLKLEVDGSPDPVATNFIGEVEVLFEMTLTLLQRAKQFESNAQAGNA